MDRRGFLASLAAVVAAPVVPVAKPRLKTECYLDARKVGESVGRHIVSGVWLRDSDGNYFLSRVVSVS
jgi:hypothetical protein